MTPADVEREKNLPAPWDRIFALLSRIFVWGLLVGIVYILRPFFLLVFLTFVFAYILEHGVQGLEHRIRSRPLRVVLVAAVFLSTLIMAGLFLAPHFKDQATKLAKNYPDYLTKIDESLDDAREQEWFRSAVPHNVKARDMLDALLGFVGPKEDDGGDGRQPANGSAADGDDPAELMDHFVEYPGGMEKLISDAGLGWREFFAFVRGRGDDAPAELIAKLAHPIESNDYHALDGTPITERWLTQQWNEARSLQDAPQQAKPNIAQTIEKLKNIAGPVLGVGSAFLLSLLFSFLIVLDLPKLSRAVVGLRDTKVRFIYEEVAENIHDFGKMLGRALEAQLFIALCNTALTALGLYFLGLTQNMIFLSTIVFFCSFIPVAGVFISSTPIALEALSVNGVQLMLLSIALILIIHFVEAYFLNPRIFGHHLHMNAVLVLIVLTIGGKLFGVWGLVLGLPVVNYFFGHAIRRRDRPDTQPKPAT